MVVKIRSHERDLQTPKFEFSDSENTHDHLRRASLSPRMVKPEIATIWRHHSVPVLWDFGDSFSDRLGDSVPPTPNILGRVRQELAEASGMLELPEDWDGESAKSIDEHTFMAARLASEVIAKRLDLVSQPFQADLSISPGADGSVSLHWSTGSRELLLVVHDGGGPADFYGDDRTAGESLKGTTRLVPPPDWIACWLAQ